MSESTTNIHNCFLEQPYFGFKSSEYLIISTPQTAAYKLKLFIPYPLSLTPHPFQNLNPTTKFLPLAA